MSHVTAGVQSSGRRHHRDSQLAEAKHSACGEQKNLAHADQATRATGYRAEAAAAIVEQIGVGDALRQAGAAPERWPEPPRAGQIDCEFGCACPLIDAMSVAMRPRGQSVTRLIDIRRNLGRFL